MANVAFNAYHFMETLEQSGQFSAAQVKNLTKALESSQTDTDLVSNAQLRMSLAEIRTEIADVRTEIATTANKTILWMIGVNLAFFTGIFGMFAKALHWY